MPGPRHTASGGLVMVWKSSCGSPGASYWTLPLSMTTVVGYHLDWVCLEAVLKGEVTDTRISSGAFSWNRKWHEHTTGSGEHMVLEVSRVAAIWTDNLLASLLSHWATRWRSTSRFHDTESTSTVLLPLFVFLLYACENVDSWNLYSPY